MNRDYPDLALDKDGIPILTDLVRDQGLKGVPAPPPAHTPSITIPAMARSPDDIARDILASDEVREHGLLLVRLVDALLDALQDPETIAAAQAYLAGKRFDER